MSSVSSAGRPLINAESPAILSPMTTKQKVIQAVQGLPENASYEDAMERLLFLSKVERGLEQADAGQTVTHSKVKEKMKRWLK